MLGLQWKVLSIVSHHGCENVGLNKEGATLFYRVKRFVSVVGVFFLLVTPEGASSLLIT